MMVSSRQPPHDLQLVIDFVNTLDAERETDELASPEGLARWLCARGLLDDVAPAFWAPQLRQATQLREALRAAMSAHNGGAQDVHANSELERAAERGQLSARFCADGSIRLEPRAAGFGGVLARLLVPVAYGAADGSWARVKACDAEDCRWAFYDQSRNRSGRWCNMAVCGNRTKVRTYRNKLSRPHG